MIPANQQDSLSSK